MPIPIGWPAIEAGPKRLQIAENGPLIELTITDDEGAKSIAVSTLLFVGWLDGISDVLEGKA